MNSFISARLHAHNDDPKMLMFSRFFKFTTGYDRLTGVYLVLEVLSTVTLRTFENSRIAQKSKKMENRLKLEYSMYM